MYILFVIILKISRKRPRRIERFVYGNNNITFLKTVVLSKNTTFKANELLLKGISKFW